MTATSPQDLVFGKYEMLKRLAIGGMGEIFLARESNAVGVDRLVILKNLLPELAQQPSFVDSFLDEARVAATLNHPNIVSMYEVGSWRGVYYICMEYIEGDSLSGLLGTSQLHNEAIPLRVAARVIRDAAMGLAHAHEATKPDGTRLGIVHRDVSPQNIMVRLDGVTKVVDFGIALANSRVTRTATGLLKGKLRYLAPEQLEQRRDLDGRADQYALGIVFWELITGVPAFQADNDAAMLFKVVNEPLALPSTRVPDLPPAFDAIIGRMVQRDRELRFPNCKALASAIDDMIFASLQLTTNETTVGEFATRVVGDTITARRLELTPSRDFVVALTPSLIDNLGDIRESQDNPTSAFGLPPKNRRRWGVPALVIMTTVLIGLAVSVVTLRRPAPPVTEPASPAQQPAPVSVPSPMAAKAERTVLVVTTDPLGAHVSAGSRQLGITPVTLELEPQTMALHFELRGYQPSDLTVTTEAGQTTTRHVVLHAEPRAPRSAAPQARAVAVEDSRSGYLSIRTQPWTRVNIDGRVYGSTPLLKIELKAGRHHVSLTNDERHIATERSVDIHAGETAKLDLAL